MRILLFQGEGGGGRRLFLLQHFSLDNQCRESNIGVTLAVVLYVYASIFEVIQKLCYGQGIVLNHGFTYGNHIMA